MMVDTIYSVYFTNGWNDGHTFNLEIDDRMKTLIKHDDFEQLAACAHLTAADMECGSWFFRVEISRCETLK